MVGGPTIDTVITPQPGDNILTDANRNGQLHAKCNTLQLHVNQLHERKAATKVA